MISAKSGLGPYFKAVTQSAGGQRVTVAFPSLKREHEEKIEGMPPLVPAFAQNMSLHKITVGQKKVFNLNAHLFNNKSQSITGIGVNHQYRLAHTDFSVPDYSGYRRKSTSDPTKSSHESSDDRRAFTYLMTAGIGVGGAIAAKNAVFDVLNLMMPAKDCLSLGKVEVNIGSVNEGKNITIKWRGKPVFIRHRTPKEIATERAMDISKLRDPESDEKRAPTPEWLVVIGICTHLGCVPIAGKGDFGGYYCPCHGSHYDASGRIRKGPAPANLAVPEYEINGDILIIG